MGSRISQYIVGLERSPGISPSTPLPPQHSTHLDFDFSPSSGYVLVLVDLHLPPL